MQKRDLPCFVLSVLVCSLILFLLTWMQTRDPIEQEELKIGLVQLENNFSLDSDGKAKTDAAPKENSSLEKKEEKVPEQKEEKEEKREEKSPSKEKLIEEEDGEIQKEIRKEEKAEVKKEEPRTEAVEAKKKPSLEDLKKQIAKPTLDKQLTNLDKFEKNNSKESGIGLDVEKILSKANGPVGLPSGSRVGTADGTAIVDWSPSNQEPVFPESARKSGKNGTVILVVLVDEAGNVLSVKMERGSGVPEINAAIEKVARTWKVKLLKKGKSVGGTFVLKYSFRLQ